MSLLDVVRRSDPPAPWAEGDKIPWNDPAFSARMLREHLSQEHDMASRRGERIDAHVRWILGLLPQRRCRILDLGCGPGLYSSRLARAGHACTGIDFSPASIEHAREQAGREGLDCRYLEADIREADYGGPYDLAMLLFGELNVFRRGDLETILRKLRAALAPGGLVLLEPHSQSFVREIGEGRPEWGTGEGGLLSERPHLWLRESFWHEQASAAVVRTFVVEAESGRVERLSETLQGYRDDELAALLAGAGLELEATHATLGEEAPDGGLVALTARVAHA